MVGLFAYRLLRLISGNQAYYDFFSQDFAANKREALRFKQKGREAPRSLVSLSTAKTVI
jgi:hypothetical protein